VNETVKDGSRPSRLHYLDWARGIAVLLMIEAHTLDAWTRLDVRRTVAYRNATILGGFAAPFFLWLAGVSLVFAAERGGTRGAGVRAVARRGLEIFVLAFLFRVQGLLVTPGGPLLMIFRVDVLNVMGPAIVAAALVWGIARSTAARAASFGAAAAAIAMATPIVRASALVDWLPIWVQWYLRPAGEQTTFTLLPWAGFVFAGAAVGALLVGAHASDVARRIHLGLVAVGAALIALGFVAATRPSIYEASSFWTSSPTWFAIRVGILMIALSGIYALDTATHRENNENSKTRRNLFPGFRDFVISWLGTLAVFGRASLFVYWIHVELVYGYASWLWRHRLPLWATAVAFVAFSSLMYGAVVLRDRVVTPRRSRRTGALTHAAPA